MCGCGNTATSGPTEAVYVATPRDGTAQEFGDKTIADAYVTALGGGTVVPKQPATAGR